jgi:hypothetical protein
MMNIRFDDLKKVPNQPAVRLLAMANIKLETKLSAPANASVQTVMVELEQANAVVDMLRVMAVALPARERIWWACLAARDVAGPDCDVVPPPLVAAESWVRKPSDAARDAARLAVEHADVDDDTVLSAKAVIFCDEKLGTGDLAQYDAPVGASQTCAFGMNIMAMGTGDDVFQMAHHLIDRAVDIARGGNGEIAKPMDKETAL